MAPDPSAAPPAMDPSMMDGPPPAPAPPPSGGGMMSPQEAEASIAAALPEPEAGGYSYKLVCKVAAATEAAIKSVIGKHAPKGGFPKIVAPPKPKGGDMLPGKLPMSIMMPALLLIDLAVSIAGPAGERYRVDPSTLTDDDDLEMLLAKLQQMPKDKALQKAVADGMKQEKAAAKGAPGPVAKPPKDTAAYL